MIYFNRQDSGEISNNQLSIRNRYVNFTASFFFLVNVMI